MKAPKKQQCTASKAAQEVLKHIELEEEEEKEELNAAAMIETPTKCTLHSGTKSLTMSAKRTRRSGSTPQKKLSGAIDIGPENKNTKYVEVQVVAEAVEPAKILKMLRQ